MINFAQEIIVLANYVSKSQVKCKYREKSNIKKKIAIIKKNCVKVAKVIKLQNFVYYT